jgi:hypothetical protein
VDTLTWCESVGGLGYPEHFLTRMHELPKW